MGFGVIATATEGVTNLHVVKVAVTVQTAKAVGEIDFESVNALLISIDITITSLALGRWMMTRGGRAGDGGDGADRR